MGVIEAESRTKPPEGGFIHERANGTIEVAESVEDARSRCPVLGKMSVEQAGLMLELAALGSEIMKDETKEKPREVEKISTPDPRPEIHAVVEKPVDIPQAIIEIQEVKTPDPVLVIEEIAVPEELVPEKPLEKVADEVVYEVLEVPDVPEILEVITEEPEKIIATITSEQETVTVQPEPTIVKSTEEKLPTITEITAPTQENEVLQEQEEEQEDVLQQPITLWEETSMPVEIAEELPEPEEQQAHHQEQPLEEIFSQLIEYFSADTDTELPELFQDEERVRELIKEIHEELPKITPKLLFLVEALGFEHPEEALELLASPEGMEFLTQSITHIHNLLSEDNPAVFAIQTGDTITVRLGRAIIGLISKKTDSFLVTAA